MDKHGIIFYATYISVDLAHYEIFHAKVGKGGIIFFPINHMFLVCIQNVCFYRQLLKKFINISSNLNPMCPIYFEFASIRKIGFRFSSFYCIATLQDM